MNPSVLLWRPPLNLSRRLWLIWLADWLADRRLQSYKAAGRYTAATFRLNKFSSHFELPTGGTRLSLGSREEDLNHLDVLAVVAGCSQRDKAPSLPWGFPAPRQLYEIRLKSREYTETWFLNASHLQRNQSKQWNWNILLSQYYISVKLIASPEGFFYSIYSISWNRNIILVYF